MAGNFKNIQYPKKRAFLNVYAQTGRIDKAAQAIESDYSLHYHWLKDDPEYAEAFREAKEMACDNLENEAIRRAYEGVQRPVYQGKELVGYVQEYSDTLLIFMLKGRRPQVFRENLDITSGGKALGINVNTPENI